MKPIIYYMRLMIVLCLLFGAKKGLAQCTASFSVVPGPAGQVTFYNTTIGAATVTSVWMFGSAASPSTTVTSSLQASTTYSANGVYTVNLSVYGTSTCSTSQTITINNVLATCIPTLSLVYGANGSVNFTATTSGSVSPNSYNWNFGNGQTSLGTSNTASMTYSANGVYTVTVVDSLGSPAYCSGMAVKTITITNVPGICNPGLTYSYGANGAVSFIATPSATGLSTYNWNFGNGLSSSGYPSTVTTTYSANGVYTVTVLDSIGFPTNCIGSAIVIVTVTNIPANCTPTLTYSLGLGGTASFTATVPGGATPGSNFFWNGGPQAFSYGSSNTYTNTYLSNGIYYIQVTYSVNVPSPCSSTAYDTIVVVNAGCNLNANFTAVSSTTNNSVSFNYNSTGLTSIATMTLDYGDGSPPFTGLVYQAPFSHSYTSAGTYTETLTINNNNNQFCRDSTTQAISVGTVQPCNLMPAFSYTMSPAGFCNFASTSIGTTANSTYTWSFGDNTYLPSGTATTVSHQYSGNGLRVIILSVDNNNTVSPCYSSTVVSVNVPCALSAAISHTVLGSGQVDFASTSTGTNPGTSFSWDYGDGFTSVGSIATHTYTNGGAYNVSLLITGDSLCASTALESVNITGVSCNPNAYFTLTPSGTPQYWNATPAYPWNVIDASWDWGDGSMDDSLYTSHTYSAAGTYSICLSVTVSCGAGATGAHCDSYAIFRTQQNAQDMSMVHVNVLKPLNTGIKQAEPELKDFTIYPNPSNGAFNIEASGLNAGTVRITVYNLVGKLILATEASPASDGSLSKDFQIDPASAGLYFVKINSGTQLITKKLVINN